jgi:tight adherence protein B
MPGPLVLDLIAAVVDGGGPPQAALRAVGSALQAVGDVRGEELLRAASRVSHPSADGIPVEPRASGSRPMTAVEDALLLAARSGLPPTALVRRAATQERRRSSAAQLRAIRRLEVLLVIPAGLCLLPAFVLLGIVPLVVDLITG